MADVTGHAVEAAIPAVAFIGILDKQMEFIGDIQERFQGLNRSLCRALGAARRGWAITLRTSDPSGLCAVPRGG